MTGDSGNVTAIPANVTGTAVYAVGTVLRMNETGAAYSFDAFSKELHARLKDPYAQTQGRPAFAALELTPPTPSDLAKPVLQSAV